MSVHKMYIVDSNGVLFNCSVSSSDSPPWSLEFENDVLGRIALAGPDLFECLCQLRHWLASKDFRILVNGARIDAWPSSMARQMGGARKLYVTRIGSRAVFEDLVPIFGETTADKLGTVKEQADYHKQWLESLS
ncbi:hypothetical protein [Paludisphaera mucosa]|uniref:Uncharacterized protein n=1 Tax=Paludisphaera mucosa TaxID=3030827 RepID=A0ABT6FID7_9BACT|nr:hypothetical protein [Paludisphaera mucosa]MDG3007307.1 hypothetical protein [Paludisphaera mucosa]